LRKYFLIHLEAVVSLTEAEPSLKGAVLALAGLDEDLTRVSPALGLQIDVPEPEK